MYTSFCINRAPDVTRPKATRGAGARIYAGRHRDVDTDRSVATRFADRAEPSSRSPSDPIAVPVGIVQTSLAQGRCPSEVNQGTWRQPRPFPRYSRDARTAGRATSPSGAPTARSARSARSRGATVTRWRPWRSRRFGRVPDGAPDRTTTGGGPAGQSLFSGAALDSAMAENPMETTDEERLVPLPVRDGEFRLDVTRPIRTEDASAGEPGDVAETAIELTPVGSPTARRSRDCLSRSRRSTAILSSSSRTHAT